MPVHRDPRRAYNEFVYTFFKCLSEERVNYVEGWYVESDATTAAETTVLDGWEVQRRCPHLKADLSRFGQVEDGVLTCQMHGWKWRLADGKCLTSVGHDIRSQRLAESAPGSRLAIGSWHFHAASERESAKIRLSPPAGAAARRGRGRHR